MAVVKSWGMHSEHSQYRTNRVRALIRRTDVHYINNQHIHPCKSYQRISVLVMEVICEPQNIAKVLRSDSHIVQTRFIDHIDIIYS